jgi:hypothetical protein
MSAETAETLEPRRTALLAYDVCRRALAPAGVVLLPAGVGARTGVPSLTNCVEGTADAELPAEIAPRPEDYVFLKRRPGAFYGTGVAELLRMLRRDMILIGGGRRTGGSRPWRRRSAS